MTIIGGCFLQASFFMYLIGTAKYLFCFLHNIWKNVLVSAPKFPSEIVVLFSWAKIVIFKEQSLSNPGIDFKSLPGASRNFTQLLKETWFILEWIRVVNMLSVFPQRLGTF